MSEEEEGMVRTHLWPRFSSLLLTLLAVVPFWVWICFLLSDRWPSVLVISQSVGGNSWMYRLGTCTCSHSGVTLYIVANNVKSYLTPQYKKQFHQAYYLTRATLVVFHLTGLHNVAVIWQKQGGKNTEQPNYSATVLCLILDVTLFSKQSVIHGILACDHSQTVRVCLNEIPIRSTLEE